MLPVQIEEFRVLRTIFWVSLRTEGLREALLQIELLERKDAQLLGDPELSHWHTVTVLLPGATSNGVTAHFQTRNPARATALPGGARRESANAHLFHGFGANLWSWQDVQQPLANYFQGTVAAHDQAGFGLTLRPDKAVEYVHCSI